MKNVFFVFWSLSKFHNPPLRLSSLIVRKSLIKALICFRGIMLRKSIRHTNQVPVGYSHLYMKESSWAVSKNDTNLTTNLIKYHEACLYWKRPQSWKLFPTSLFLLFYLSICLDLFLAWFSWDGTSQVAKWEWKKVGFEKGPQDRTVVTQLELHNMSELCPGWIFCGNITEKVLFLWVFTFKSLQSWSEDIIKHLTSSYLPVFYLLFA